jgi:hypothetical protein
VETLGCFDCFFTAGDCPHPIALVFEDALQGGAHVPLVVDD